MQGCEKMPKTAPPHTPSGVRKGKFQWMNEESKQRFLEQLSERIAAGYYFSDPIIAKVVDEIAPVIEDSIDDDCNRW